MDVSKQISKLEILISNLDQIKKEHIGRRTLTRCDSLLLKMLTNMLGLNMSAEQRYIAYNITLLEYMCKVISNANLATLKKDFKSQIFLEMVERNQMAKRLLGDSIRNSIENEYQV